MSRSILLSIMFIAGTLGVIAFSAAQFTDFETSDDDVVAGTLDLVYVADAPATADGELECTFDTDGLEGQSGTPEPAAETQAVCAFSVQHTGSLNNGELYVMILDVVGAACALPPSEHCDVNADLTRDQFLFIDMVSDWVGFTDPSSPTTDLADFVYTPDMPSGICILINDDVDANETTTGSYTIELQQAETTNAMQGDSITLTVNFELIEDGGLADCLIDV